MHLVPSVDDKILTEKVQLFPMKTSRPLLKGRKTLIMLVGLTGSPVNDYVTFTDAIPLCGILPLNFGTPASDAISDIRRKFLMNNCLVVMGDALVARKYRKKVLRAFRGDGSLLKIACYEQETREDWNKRLPYLQKAHDTRVLNRVWGGHTTPSTQENFNFVLDSLHKLLTLTYMMEHLDD